jgi:hypothetical protein
MGENHASDRSESLREFLMRDLPRGKLRQLSYLMEALKEAAARYDRYAARRDDWRSYARRGGHLRGIARKSFELINDLTQLDILSRDDLESRIGKKEIGTLIGSLGILSNKAAELSNEAQDRGRSRDLAEERWILELADIFENAFDRPASVWGPGDGPARRSGKFYRLLELCLPLSFPRYGKLSVRQIGRVLERRNARIGKPRPATLLPEPPKRDEPE